MTRMVVALAFGLMTLLCCCRLGLMKMGDAQAAATPMRHCCAERTDSSKKTPERSQHCPMCDGVVGVVVKADTDKAVAPPVPVPPDFAGDVVSPFSVGVELTRVVRLAENPPPRPTLVSLHTCLLC